MPPSSTTASAPASASVPAEGRGPRAGTAPHVVIVGAGFGGLEAAKALKDAPVRVSVVDRRNYYLFQPLLYQVATAALSPADITLPIRTILRRQRNTAVLLGVVTGIDVEQREVVLADGRLPYDYLILAAGAQTAYFGHDDWEELAPSLKGIEDATAVRSKVFRAFEEAERETDEAKRRALLTFVIVGGGPTGVELAGALGEIARQTLRREFRSIDPATARILLVEGGPRVLATYPESLSRAAARSLEHLGVEVVTNARVTMITPDAVTFGDERIATRTVLWAAGVTSSPVGSSLGVPLGRGGRVPVGRDLSLAGQGHPEIFVVGDLAAATDERGRPYPGVAQVAMQGGRTAAANVVRLVAGEPTAPFHYHDLGEMATIGRNAAVGVIGPLKLSGFVAWAAWVGIHIINLIGFRNRLVVMTEWVWLYFTRQRGARLITEHGPRQPTPHGEIDSPTSGLDSGQRTADSRR